MLEGVPVQETPSQKEEEKKEEVSLKAPFLLQPSACFDAMGKEVTKRSFQLSWAGGCCIAADVRCNLTTWSTDYNLRSDFKFAGNRRLLTAWESMLLLLEFPVSNTASASFVRARL